MEEKLLQRLEGLKNEYMTGQKKLAELEAQTQALKETMLRISGAIQVLEEETRSGDNNVESNLAAQAGAEPADSE